MSVPEEKAVRLDLLLFATTRQGAHSLLSASKRRELMLRALSRDDSPLALIENARTRALVAIRWKLKAARDRGRCLTITEASWMYGITKQRIYQLADAGLDEIWAAGWRPWATCAPSPGSATLPG